MTPNCPYFYAFRFGSALKRQGNVPCKCPVALCDATSFTLGMASCLLCVDPDTDVVLLDWKVDRTTPRKAHQSPWYKCTMILLWGYGAMHSPVRIRRLISWSVASGVANACSLFGAMGCITNNIVEMAPPHGMGGWWL